MVKPLVKLGLRSRPAATYAGIRRAEPLILCNIRPGACFKVDNLYLQKEGPQGISERTPFFLSGTVSRHESGFYCEFTVNFGSEPPQLAGIRVRGDSKSRPRVLVQNGKALSHVPVTLAPSAGTEIITLEIATKGSEDVPRELFAEIRTTPKRAQNGDEDNNPTVPLGTSIPTPPPVLDLEQTAALGQALKACANPHLQTLGELFAAKVLDERNIFFGQLVTHNADTRIIEAGARVIGLYHPMMELENLDLNDPASAFLSTFHPQAPIHLLESDFSNALEKACKTQQANWTPIAKSALLVLLQTEGGRRILQELVTTYFSCGEGLIGGLLHDLLIWGRAKLNKLAIYPPAPADDCLDVISGPNERAAFQAAMEYLKYFGFIRISDLLI